MLNSKPAGLLRSTERVQVTGVRVIVNYFKPVNVIPRRLDSLAWERVVVALSHPVRLTGQVVHVVDLIADPDEGDEVVSGVLHLTGLPLGGGLLVGRHEVLGLEEEVASLCGGETLGGV